MLFRLSIEFFVKKADCRVVSFVLLSRSEGSVSTLRCRPYFGTPQNMEKTLPLNEGVARLSLKSDTNRLTPTTNGVGVRILLG